jgi:translocation and assembly module TamB
MSQRIRKIVIGLAAAIGLVLLTLATGLFALQTSWFKNKVREKIVGAIEGSTGGTVRLGAFDYSWPTLTGDFQNLVVHGTETADAAPLFRADSIHVRLRIISLFKREVDVASLIVNRPQIHVSIAADGETNVPSPRLGRRSSADTIADLLDLKVRHFEFNNGIFEAAARKTGLSLRGENISVLLIYDRRGPQYKVKISSHSTRVDAEQWPAIDIQLDVSAQLERDRVVVQRAAFMAGSSSVVASGTLQHFARPTGDFKVVSQLAAADLAKIPSFTDLHRGQFTLDGTAHYDDSTRFTFVGTMAGRDVLYRYGSFIPKGVDFHSDVHANQQRAEFTRLTLNVGRAHLAGEAMLPNYRELQLDGTVTGLSTAEAVTWVSARPLPWTGVANGTIHAHGSLGAPWPNLRLDGKVRITAASPGAPGVPVSGDVEATYRRPGNVIEFKPSHLDSANTQVSFSGKVGAALQVTLDSKDLNDVKPVLPYVSSNSNAIAFPLLLKNGSAHFDGIVAGPLRNPQLAGNLALTHFRMQGQICDQLLSRVVLSSDDLAFSSAVIDQASLHATATGHVALENWTPMASGSLRLHAQFRGADIGKLFAGYRAIKLPMIRGLASGAIDIDGSPIDPRGSAEITIDNVNAYGESINQVHIAATVGGDEAQITRGRMQAGPAVMSFSGRFRHALRSWGDGDIQMRIDSNGFPLASLTPVRQYGPGLNAQFEIHAEAAVRITAGHIEPRNADGTALFRKITVNNVPYGGITFNAATRGQLLKTSFSGDLRGSRLSGSAEVQLPAGNSAKGEVHLDRIALSTLNSVLNRGERKPLPVDGFVTGGVSFEGPLQQPERLRGTLRITDLQISSNLPGQTQPANLFFRNVSPIVLEAANGIATIRTFELGGKDTKLTTRGSIPYLQQGPINLDVNGSMDLRFFQLLDPKVQSSGQSLVAASVRGTPAKPVVNGTVQVKNGSFLFSNFANGLTAVNGTVQFDRDRATIRELTAQTGGGDVSLLGFVSFASTGRLIYRLEANAQNVRMRYAGGISVTATSQLRLTGTSENSTLSGTATISRVVLSPNTDIGALLASTAAPTQASSNTQDFLTGMQFDVRLQSTPNLQLNTELSRDVQANIDLRLRGTPVHPILLGNIAANQGDIKIFGTKYSINRAEASFTNPARIEPVLALDLQTRARGITVDITISGTLGKLNINYRSDPPLQPREIIALLAVGHTPDLGANLVSAQTVNDVSALQSRGSTIVGQAISPSSNRLSKLFGVTNIRIDPTVQTITNASQARLTVEQNISRDVTVTYVTNLSQTSEQIFRVEWALNPQYSMVALRDDNGEFGVDILYRKRFK